MTQTVQENYAEAGFGQTLGFGERPALLMVDFVKAYLVEDSPLYAGVETVRDNCARLLEAARSAGIPVLHTNVSYQPGGADGGLFMRKLPLLKVFEEGSPLGDFVDGLEPAAGETVITKQFASGFFGTELANVLSSLDVDTVLVAGVTTSGCVRATALDALQNGFAPVVVRDAVGDRNPAPHEANLFDLQAKYADVISLSEAIEYLERIGVTDSQ